MSRLDAALVSVGAQPRPFRALIRTFVALDLRGQFYGLATGAKAGELVAPLYWVVAQMLTVSFLLAMLLQARVTADVYAFAHLSATALFVFSAVVVEFREAAFDPSDVLVIGHRPVTARTWALARGTNLALYVALIGLATTVFPTGMGLGLRDTSWWWVVAFPWANAVTAVAAAGAALAVYAAGRAEGPGENLRKLAAWVQIVAILVLFYGGQLMFRDGHRDVAWLAAHPPDWVRWVPTHVLAEAVVAGRWELLGVGTVVSGGLAGVAALLLQRAWTQVSAVPDADRSVPVRSPLRVGTLTTWWTDRVWSDRRSAAVYHLARAALSRDDELRARGVPAIALPLTTAILGVVTGQYADPMAVRGPEAVLPIATGVVLLGGLPTWQHNLGFGEAHRAAWRLRAAWGPAAAEGARVAVLAWMPWPFVAVHAWLLLVLWRDPVSVALYSGTLLALLSLVSRLIARTLLAEPILRRPAPRGGTLGGVVVVVAGVGALASALGGAWYLAAAEVGASVAFLAALMVGSWLLGRLR